MRQGTIVRHGKDGREGVVIDDTYRCCSPDETLVVYWGDTFGLGTQTDELEAIGEYDATPDMHKCGSGRGSDCCMFLTVGADGPCCERFSSMRNQLIFRTMSSKRHPSVPFPECMIFEGQGGG